MKNYYTKYGEIAGIGEFSIYPDEKLKECMVTKRIEITTEYGVLTPQYEFGEDRRKYTYSMSFFNDGALRRIALHEKSMIKTPLGDMEAELITFYKSGRIKRVFPLNGRISAYWSERDESKLATVDVIETSVGIIRAKIIAYSFYETGELKDLTFWPGQDIKVNTLIGELKLRIGISFYKNGKIKSFEPLLPVKLNTVLGKIEAYDYNANGMNGDVNSIVFSEDGNVNEFITFSKKVTVKDNDGNTIGNFSPVQELDEDGAEICFRGLKFKFEGDTVIINDCFEYDLTECDFDIEDYVKTAQNMCASCGS